MAARRREPLAREERSGTAGCRHRWGTSLSLEGSYHANSRAGCSIRIDDRQLL